LLLAFEAGYASAECPIVVVTEWDRAYKERQKGWLQDDAGIVYTSAIEVLEELERANPYEFIVIDTIDMLVKMASDHYCAAAKVEHPSDGGDYGRGYDLLQTTPVRRFYNRLTRIGCGIAAITHVKERTEKDKFGVERYRRETTLPGAIQSFVHTQSDIIMAGFFGRRRRGQIDRDRIISFDGTDEVMAGTRVRQVHIPRKYIVAPPTSENLDSPWRQWEEFFNDNPQAGKRAEADYAKLFEGLDDETTASNSNSKERREKQ
jgi:hypothetical protein